MFDYESWNRSVDSVWMIVQATQNLIAVDPEPVQWFTKTIG